MWVHQIIHWFQWEERRTLFGQIPDHIIKCIVITGVQEKDLLLRSLNHSIISNDNRSKIALYSEIGNMKKS